LTFLLDIRNHDDLLSHPVLGTSFEGFAMENILAVAGCLILDTGCWQPLVPMLYVGMHIQPWMPPYPLEFCEQHGQKIREMFPVDKQNPLL
jgi:hypothetical protein